MQNRKTLLIHPARAKLIFEELYAFSVVLNDYCSAHREAEEINNIIPLIKIISENIDYLNAYFINK